MLPPNTAGAPKLGGAPKPPGEVDVPKSPPLGEVAEVENNPPEVFPPKAGPPKSGCVVGAEATEPNSPPPPPALKRPGPLEAVGGDVAKGAPNRPPLVLLVAALLTRAEGENRPPGLGGVTVFVDAPKRFRAGTRENNINVEF